MTEMRGIVDSYTFDSLSVRNAPHVEEVELLLVESRSPKWALMSMSWGWTFNVVSTVRSGSRIDSSIYALVNWGCSEKSGSGGVYVGRHGAVHGRAENLPVVRGKMPKLFSLR